MMNITNIRTRLFELINAGMFLGIMHVFGFEVAVVYALAVISGAVESEVWVP